MVDRRVGENEFIMPTMLSVAIAVCLAIPAAWSQGAYNLQQPPPQRPPLQQAPKVFVQTCTLCHGGDARGTDRAPSLVNTAKLRGMPDSEVSDIIRKGKNQMPAFPLPQADIDELTRYVRSLNTIESAGSVAGDAKA